MIQDQSLRLESLLRRNNSELNAPDPELKYRFFLKRDPDAKLIGGR